MFSARKMIFLDLFRIRYAKDKSIYKYLRNLLNGMDIFQKLIYMQGIILLFKKKALIGFISVENYYDDIYKVNDLYLEKNIEGDFDKNIILNLLQASKLIYEHPKEVYNYDQLYSLGFRNVDKTIFMKLDLTKIDQYHINYQNERIVLFRKNSDEGLRCILQNQIFGEDGRNPITIEDIYFDEKQPYYLDDMSYFLYVEEKAIGYGQIIYYYGEYVICNFGILSDYRRKGHGKVLLQYLINYSKQKNIDKLFIKVSENNQYAKRLYKKLGFKEQYYMENFELKG